MNINKLILDTLKPIKVPVNFMKYTGDATTYILFQEYLQQGQEFSEDTEELTGHYILLNVYSKSNYNSLVSQVKDLLSDVGFSRQSEYDLYDKSTGYYNHVLKLYFEEELINE